MATLSPEQAALILHAVGLPAVRAEHPVTRSVIAAILPDRLDYRPDPVARTAFDLAWHIVTAENRFLEAVAAGQFDLTPWERPASVRTPADVIAWYDDRLGRSVERLKTVSGEDLLRTIDFRGILQWQAVRFVPLAVSHSIHHRGQLSVYLRSMGAAVPSIYGESYDARRAREKKAGAAGS
jgi:uncharacterized damage-inducible protein DinB